MDTLSNLSRITRVLLVILVVTGCASPVKTGMDYNEAADFGAYRTFAWMETAPAGSEGGAVSPLTLHRIRSSLEETLIQKGFELTPDLANADIVVTFVVGTRDKISASSYPRSFTVHRRGWVWCGPFCYDDEVIVRTYTEGTLSVDMFDAETRTPVWHGWASKTITESDRDNPREAIKMAVEQLLEPFPPEMKQGE
ncbi:MAG: DUF4136 domain-containing protein [Xanthomonadales bacterium]|nr:DUF4136 domain-containing protein [Xanthomonadales bacterium]